MNKIPLLDLSTEVDALWDELNAAVQNVLRSGLFINGPAVQTFEEGVASYCGTKYAVALNSGTDALVIGLRAMGVKPGDEVITSAFSFFATPEAISQLGAVPIFVDIDPVTYNLDVTEVASKTSTRTKAIIPVHLYGLAADMDPLLELAQAKGLKVLEDVAQAFGGTYKGKRLGSIGDSSALSFFPSKNLGAYGDGGMLLTNDAETAETAKMLRAHGAKKKYYNEMVGYNSRLDTIQAAILNVKLPHIDSWIKGRRAVAKRYDEGLGHLKNVVLPRETAYGLHSYYSYTLRIIGGRRDEVRKALMGAGIETMIYYPVPLHKLPIYTGLGYKFPRAEKAASEVLSLPIWPQMDGETQARVVTEVTKALSH